MKKVLILSLGIIFIILIFSVIKYINKDNTVNFQVIRDEQQLDKEIIDWINKQKQNKGIHLYSLDNSNSYEILVYYNRNEEKNLYINPKLDTRIVNGILKINIKNELANDDSYVKDKLIVHSIIKQKPKDIEIYIDEQKQSFYIESGTNKILK